MKFVIPRVSLQENLSRVTSIIPTKSTFTVLQNILLETSKNKISIQGTDLEMFIKREFTCDVSEEGKVMVPGKKIIEILRETDEEVLNFNLSGQLLKIEAGKTVFNLPYLDPQEFPEMPKLPNKVWFKIEFAQLNRMVEATGFSVARDVGKGAMTGILIQLKGKELRMVSTDGHRLSFIKDDQLKIETKERTEGEIIVPPKVFELMSDINGDEKIEIRLGEEGRGEESLIGFSFASTTIVSRVIQGPFPDYEKVIPTSFTGEVRVQKSHLEGALRRVGLFSNRFTRAVKISFPNRETLNIYASTPEEGEAREDVSCSFQGGEITIGFNAGYLLEVLKHIRADEISLNFTSPATAALIKGVGDSGADNLYLIMPLRMESW